MICTCDSDKANLGVGGKNGVSSIVTLLLTDRFDSSKVRNCFDTTATINAALINGKLKNEDKSKRLFPLLNLESFNSEAGDPITEEFPSGRIVAISDGIVAVSFVVPVSDPYKLKAKLDTFSCEEIDVHPVDECGNLIGEKKGTDLCGRKIQKNSMVTKVINESQDGVAGKVEVTFNLEKSSNDRKVDFISNESITDFDLTEDIIPLLDVNINFTSASTTTVVITLTDDWDGITDRSPALGLDATNLEIFNETATSTPALTSVVLTDESKGEYTITIASAQTINDVIRVQGVGGNIQKGFDLARVKATTTVIA